ncbi:hypothetical protein HPB48_019561 [Haemaphysalis longicornis]|uniref:CCHC-type domain-containing protein n=1 Tax=Haemaphysalis longicornis TaxID=44386 RepID=A0A9J6GE18_HAELO|nr:hypothetical protein HPB48_019561 [Haemaphysalis longicornis]
MLQPPDPGNGEMDQSKPPDETAAPPETPKNPLYEWHTVVNGKYIPVSKLNTSNGGAVMMSSRQPLLPRDEHKVTIRPRNGLQLNAIGTVALARALSKTVQAPKEISNNSIKEVIHQIPQGTTEEELRDQIRADGYNVIQARMLGRSTSAVITFEGKTLPHHFYYWGAYVRCYPYRRSTLVCHVCRKMGHRADVCPNSSEGACGDCGEKHNPQQLCTPKCAICQEEHSTGSNACNQRYRPPVKPKQTTDDKTSTTGPGKQDWRQKPDNDTGPGLKQENQPTHHPPQHHQGRPRMETTDGEPDPDQDPRQEPGTARRRTKGSDHHR